MWKMDKFGEHPGLESQRMENKEVPLAPESAGYLQIVAFLVAVTTLCQFKPLQFSFHSQATEKAIPDFSLSRDSH